MTNGQSADKSFAYILGVFLGDGCVYSAQGHPRFNLKVADKDFAEATKEALSNLTNYKLKIHFCPQETRQDIYDLVCGDPWVCMKLVEDTEFKTQIPQYVHKWSKELKKEFIAGLMDSEGFVQESPRLNYPVYLMGFKSCDVWIQDFIRVLESVGVKIGKVSQERPRKAHFKIPTRFAIKMRSWYDSGCYFKIKRKQDRVTRWATGPRTKRRLISETIRLTPKGDDIVRSHVRA